MVKSIDELKILVVDGMKLKAGNKEIEIRRFPNNVIKVHNKLISWADFRDLLINSDYELIVNEQDVDLLTGAHQEPAKKNQGRGGRRPGSGRKKLDNSEKKKPSLFTLSPEALEALDYLCGIYGDKKSSIIDKILINKAEVLKRLEV